MYCLRKILFFAITLSLVSAPASLSALTPTAPAGGADCDMIKDTADEKNLEMIGDLDDEDAPEIGETFTYCNPNLRCMERHEISSIDDITFDWESGGLSGTRPTATCSICTNGTSGCSCARAP